MNKDRIEILIGGIGGQGVVYSANLIARAGLIRHKFASSIAHYGPESRGSVTTSEVVISNNQSGDLDYPVVETPDVFIAMHQKAYDAYMAKHKIPPAHLIYDSTIVNPDGKLSLQDKRSASCEFIGVPASQMAKDKLGNIMMANIILTAAFAKTTGIISQGELEETLKGVVSSPMDFTLNKEAIEIGFSIN